MGVSGPTGSDQTGRSQLAWDKCKRHRNQLVFAMAGHIFIFLTIAFLIAKVFHTTTPCSVSEICWVLLVLVTGFCFERFSCLRCGEPFFEKWRYLYHIPLPADMCIADCRSMRTTRCRTGEAIDLHSGHP